MPYRFPKEKIERAIVAGVVDGLNRVAIEFQRETIKMLSRPGTGKMTGRYQRSAPGEPPAVQTGTLRRSWQATLRPARAMFGSAVVNIGSNLHYAPHLEYGTRRGLKPRPYVRPVAEIINRKANGIIDEQVAKRLSVFNKTGA